MARGRSNSQRMRRTERDNYSISNGSLFRPILSDVEDRRYYHPEDDDAPALTTQGRPARFAFSSVVRAPTVNIHSRPFIARDFYTNSFRGFQPPVGIKFQGAFPIVTCLRRKMRQEVMIALGRHKRRGSGGGRRNWRSDVKC